ncbi:hypothetical protein ONZ45_g14759 [Pleurotus djamor]|nr:hypothetical protein ONZ45_g14759 [Pleurotus djamor]
MDPQHVIGLSFEHNSPIVPFTRERLDDPPPVFQSFGMSPRPHRTPGYTYGWRVTIEELREGMAKYGEEYDVYHPSALRSCIKKQWKEQKYADKFGTSACPNARIVPLRRNAELEMFVCLFSNGDQASLELSQAKEAAAIIKAAREVLNLGAEADKTLMWHCLNPVEPYKRRAQSDEDTD